MILKMSLDDITGGGSNWTPPAGGGTPVPDPMGAPPAGPAAPTPGPAEPTQPTWPTPQPAGPTEPATGGMPGATEPPQPESDTGTVASTV